MSLSVVNYFFVLLYGLVLSLSFVDISIRKNLKSFVLVVFGFCVEQTLLYFLFGENLLYEIYPFVTHIPLIIIIICYYKKSLKIALISVLTAYLLCIPRKWIGTIISALWEYNSDISLRVQIIVTIPLLVLIIKMASPLITGLIQEDSKVISLFIYVPLTYYLIEYGITVYSDLLYSGGPAVVEFLDASIVIVYFIFSVMYLKISSQKRSITLVKTNLEMLIKQSEFEIASMKQSQKSASIYRHDMKHHLSLIGGYLTDGDMQSAMDYIRLTQEDIEEITPNRFSENITVNLILSSFTAKAKARGIGFFVKAKLQPNLSFPETELCALLSNGLENAINAAALVENEQFRIVRANFQTHKKNLLIFIENSYNGEITMEDGLPKNNDEGHGFGVKSISMIAEKHNGYCSFTAKEEIFTLKVVLPLGK